MLNTYKWAGVSNTGCFTRGIAVTFVGLPWGHLFSLLASQKLQMNFTFFYPSQLNLLKKYVDSLQLLLHSGFYPYVSLFSRMSLIIYYQMQQVLHLAPLKHMKTLTMHSLAKTTHHSPLGSSFIITSSFFHPLNIKVSKCLSSGL